MKIAQLVVFVLALSLGAIASIGQESQTKTKGGKAVTVTGCLQKGDEAGEYSITGEDGKRYGLRSQGVDLAKHEGHKVSVTGTKMREGNEAKEKHEAGAKEEDMHLRVSDLKHISETCQ
jgi:hypothetical protein